MKSLVLVCVFVAGFSTLTNAKEIEISYTTKNVKCASECVKISGILRDSYQCWTGWGTSEWDYCTKGKLLAFQFYTSQHQTKVEKCYGHCGAFGSKNNWCFTNAASNEWDYCSLYPNQNYNNEECIEPCKKTSDGYKCVNNKQEEKFCSPAFDDSFQRKQFNANIAFKLGNYGLNGFTRCNPDYEKQLPASLDFKTDIDYLIARHQLTFPNTVVNIPDSGNTSITNYLFRTSPPIPGKQNVKLTYTLTAKILPADLNYEKEDMIPNFIPKRMELLDALPTDAFDPLLSVEVGGSRDQFNYLPMGLHLSLGWNLFREEIRTFLEKPDAGYVSFKLVVFYGDLTKTRRPEAYGLRIRKYLNDEKLSQDSNDLYFSNNIDDKCKLSYVL